MFKNLRKWLAVSLIIASVFILFHSPAKAATSINDLNSVSDYAKASIERLVTKGIILGDNNGNFNPSTTITRAEMVTMVVKALNVDTTIIPSTATFKDVPKENWAFKYVEAAYKAGVINGVGDDYFDPNQMCTREQLAVIFIKAMGIKESEIVGKQPLYIIRQLKDKDKISPWATDFIEFAMDSGLLKGTGGWNFGPDQKAPREQAAVLIDRILENKEDILSFHKSYSGNIQYPELFNALREHEFNYIGSVELEKWYRVMDSESGDVMDTSNKLTGKVNLYDHQYTIETFTLRNGQSISNQEYLLWQIGDKTYYKTVEEGTNTEFDVATNEELGLGEDYEVARAGTNSFNNLFAKYQITKIPNVTVENSYPDESDNQVATEYRVIFTRETIKPYVAILLNNDYINSKDVKFEDLFNVGYTITLNFYLDDIGRLIREEYSFDGNIREPDLSDNISVYTYGFQRFFNIQ